MTQIKKSILPTVGLIGSAVCLGIFFAGPSFPTPDRLIAFGFFVLLMFRRAADLLVRLSPFAVLVVAYEAFGGIAASLNARVHYLLGPRADQWLFGGLPTKTLQNWLWKGHTSWYDVLFYIPYILFFVVPLGLAILVWKTQDKFYWRVVTTYLTVFFAGFLTFLLYPAAPPWLASQNHYIEPIARISTSVWYSLGVHNFSSLYSHIAPNPVAAVPSLHAACATLLSIFIFKIYGKRWGLISLIYPALLYVGVVYEGEHYAFDVITGIIYAFGGYFLTPYLIRRTATAKHHLSSKYGKRLAAVNLK